MIASLFLNGEAVGCVVHRGFNKRNLVKSHDLKLRARLHRLFNSSMDGLTYNYSDGNCEAKMRSLAPGTTEHFELVAHTIQERSPYTVELVGV